jgi:hypothetical protein
LEIFLLSICDLFPVAFAVLENTFPQVNEFSFAKILFPGPGHILFFYVFCGPQKEYSAAMG